MLSRKGQITVEVVKLILSWWHSRFNVHCCPRIRPADGEAMENIARYVIWASFSQERMSCLPCESKGNRDVHSIIGFLQEDKDAPAGFLHRQFPEISRPTGYPLTAEPWICLSHPRFPLIAIPASIQRNGLGRASRGPNGSGCWTGLAASCFQKGGFKPAFHLLSAYASLRKSRGSSPKLAG